MIVTITSNLHQHPQLANICNTCNQLQPMGEFSLMVSTSYLFQKLQGVPKKMVILSGFEFLTLGGVFLGVKNNSKNFGNKKILGCLVKFSL